MESEKLIFASILIVIGRSGIALANNFTLFISLLLTIVAIGTSLTIPILQIGIKRITQPLTRPAAFAAFYIVMNIGAMLSGWIIDLLR